MRRNATKNFIGQQVWQLQYSTEKVKDQVLSPQQQQKVVHVTSIDRNVFWHRNIMFEFLNWVEFTLKPHRTQMLSDND